MPAQRWKFARFAGNPPTGCSEAYWRKLYNKADSRIYKEKGWKSEESAKARESGETLRLARQIWADEGQRWDLEHQHPPPPSPPLPPPPPPPPSPPAAGAAGGSSAASSSSSAEPRSNQSTSGRSTRSGGRSTGSTSTTTRAGNTSASTSASPSSSASRGNNNLNAASTRPSAPYMHSGDQITQPAYTQYMQKPHTIFPDFVAAANASRASHPPSNPVARGSKDTSSARTTSDSPYNTTYRGNKDRSSAKSTSNRTDRAPAGKMSAHKHNPNSPAGGRTSNPPSMTDNASSTTTSSMAPNRPVPPNPYMTDEQMEAFESSARESRPPTTLNSPVPMGSRVSTGGNNDVAPISTSMSRSQSFDKHTEKARKGRRNESSSKHSEKPRNESRDTITSPSSETRPSTSSSDGNTKRKLAKGRSAAATAGDADVAMTDAPGDQPTPKRSIEGITVDDLFTPEEQRAATEQAKVAESKERAKQAKHKPPTKGKGKPKRKANPKDKKTRDNDPEDPGDESDDGRKYCTCRSSDTSGLMVFCEGECGDWYHARCVGIPETASELIMRFYCPKCTIEDGIHQTLWNSKCAYANCPRARRGDRDDPTVKKSKFCTNEHAALWAQAFVASFRQDSKPSLGGRLNIGEFKTILQSWENYPGTWDEWKKSMEPGKDPEFAQKCFFGPTTTARRKKIGYTYEVPTVPEDVRKRIRHLVDDEGREKIAAAEALMEKSRVEREGAKIMIMALKGALEHLSAWMKANPGHASICGCDYRLARDGEEWILWLATSEGQKLKETGVMPVPAEDDEEAKEGGKIEGMCGGNPTKCMHNQWFKLAMSQARSDIAIANESDIDRLRAINRVWDIALTREKREVDPTLLPKPAVTRFRGWYIAQGLPVPPDVAAPPQAGTTTLFPNRR